jgi:hypothetical protein
LLTTASQSENKTTGNRRLESETHIIKMKSGLIAMAPIQDTGIVYTTGHQSRRRKSRKHYARISLTDVEGWGIGVLMLASFFWVLAHLL